ncbi:YciI family protein [Cellulomonas gilvus]|uniref:YCII-related protein n=1 Tax=Cellulomonas gilvus (strain ATCC 13127 / NRRL B-14078) TaxID=593907 RepID=F8A5I6_CELGA|nr:YciI family protein [Cellulomonas gilvus]AEI12141.1 YCII-related protein [Cellulomonas gilvus ATCC 13127]
MPTYAVRYTYDERAEVRDRVRPEHRAYLAGLADAGALRGSGPFPDGPPGALLVFEVADEAALRRLLDDDPFAREGLVAATEIRRWDVVIGPWSA